MSNKPSRFRRKGKTMPITLAVDPDDAPVIAAGQNKIAAAELTLAELTLDASDGDRAEAEGAVTAAKAEFDELLPTHPVVTLTVERPKEKDREELLKAHPATDEQQADFAKAVEEAGDDWPEGASKVMAFDPDTYYPALLAASCIKVQFSDEDEPRTGLTPADARELWDSASNGDRLTVQSTFSVLVVSSSRVAELGKG